MKIASGVCVLLIALMACVESTNAMYEDQAGKFDWHQKYFGRIRFILNDPNQPKRVIVGAENNVIGAVHGVTGAVLYRNVLESTGQLHHLAPYGDKHILAISAQDTKIKARSFVIQNGLAQNEWIFKEDATHFTEFNSNIYFVNTKGFPKVKISKFNIKDGKGESDEQLLPIMHKEVSAGLEEADLCEVVAPYLVCAQGPSVSIIHLESGTVLKRKLEIAGSIKEVSVTGSSQISAVAFKGDGFAKVFRIVQNSKSEPELVPVPYASKSPFVALSQMVVKSEPILFVSTLETAHSINMDAYNTKNEKQTSMSMQIQTSMLIPSLALAKGVCTGSQCGFVGFTKDELLFGTKFSEKGATQMEWSRQEALAHVVNVEMVDYPEESEVAWDPQAQYEMITGFFGKFKKQIETMIIGGKPDVPTADRFAIRKLIVFITSIGKVLGMDSTTGQILYSFILPEFGVFSDSSVQLYIQRPSNYAPLKPLASVVYRSSKPNSKTTILFPFNPVEGNHLDEPQTYPPIIQSQMLLHRVESLNFMKPILLLDSNHVIHTYPANIPEVKNTFFFTAEKNNGNPVLKGFAIKSNQNNNKLAAKLTWDLKLGKTELLGVYGKLPGEVVQSQGKVLPDRSVSYKYVNPNLVVAVTYEAELGNINIFLVDVVSGAVVHSFWHKKAKGPVHVVHSEHWMVYSLYSEKSRRYEVTSVELYEGQTQSNSTTFSSFASPPIQPIIAKQSYIFPTGINVLAHTRTAKGITNKDILIGLPNGGILELPRMILQPRLSQSQYVHQVQDEDGVVHSVPYIPELPVPAEMIINYNQSVMNVHGIKTWPTKLESTCLVLVYGNDLFFTKVAPSKTFDVLKDDFDHWFITIVLGALCIATYATKKLAQRKHLEQLWR